MSEKSRGGEPLEAAAPLASFVYFRNLGGPPRGNPAFSRESTIFSIVVFSSSKVTFAICEYGLTSALSALATLMRVQLTLSWVKGHSQLGSRSSTTLSLAIAVEAPIRMASTTVISTRRRDLDLMDEPPF